MTSNTSAGQFLTFKFGPQLLDPINERLTLPTENNDNLTGPLPISLTMSLWADALLLFLNFAFPSGDRSFLFPSLHAHGLSYLAVGYFCDPLQLSYSTTGNFVLYILVTFGNSSQYPSKRGLEFEYHLQCCQLTRSHV